MKHLVLAPPLRKTPMTDETKDNETADTQTYNLSGMDIDALREALAATLKVREIERIMLARAIGTIVEFTQKPPQEVIAILSSDIDKQYQDVADDVAKPHLYIPNQGEKKLHIPLAIPRTQG